MSQRTALCIASIAGAVAALAPTAAADWWLTTIAHQTYATVQTEFRFRLQGNRAGDVLSGGENALTNSFTPFPKRTQFYVGIDNETIIKFYEFGGAGIGQSALVDRYFGVVLKGSPTDKIGANWVPNTDPVPILPYSWVITQIAVQVTIKNPSPVSHAYVGFAGICFNRAASPSQAAGQIPQIGMMAPIPQFFGVLGPGESRMVEIPGVQPTDLIGLYARAWWGDAPGPEELSAVTWMGGNAASCYADCNADGGLSVADFGCFQTRFVAGDPYADCSGDGVLTVADFGCFQTKFVAACP